VATDVSARLGPQLDLERVVVGFEAAHLALDPPELPEQRVAFGASRRVPRQEMLGVPDLLLEVRGERREHRPSAPGISRQPRGRIWGRPLILYRHSNRSAT
jgi:hypothetical protein